MAAERPTSQHPPGANPSGVVTAAAPWLLLGVLACLPYLESFGYGFVDYDDPSTIVNLPLIRRLDLASLPEFFAPNVYAGLPEYMPLKNLSYAVDYALFGLDPQGFRLQQQLWYVCAVLLAFGWLRELLRRTLGEGGHADRVAWLCAALFGLHPVHVESVAWLSGRKDLLSGAFVFASLWAALRWPGHGRPGTRWLWLAVGFAVLALLSKPTAVVLPALLGVQELLLGPEPRPWQRLRRKLALHLLVGGACLTFVAFYVQLTAPYAQASTGHEWRSFDGPTPLRWGQQVLVLLQMAVWPVQLAVVHPPSVLSAEPWSARALLGAFTLVSLAAGVALTLLRRSRWALPLSWFLVPLGPVLFAPAWQQYVAGRYLFHAVLGVCLALALLLQALARHRPQFARLAMAGAVVVSLSWGAATHQYARCFRDPSSLWEGALAVYPRFGWAYSMAAGAALAREDPGHALGLLERCLHHVPNDSRCKALLGRLLVPFEPSRAESLLREALPADTGGEAHETLAMLLAATGRASQAVTLYSGWLSGRATNTRQITVLARLQLSAGQPDAAVAAARKALDAMAVNAPASPPPLRLLVEVARAAKRPELVERLEAAAARCTRADCLAAAMRW